MKKLVIITNAIYIYLIAFLLIATFCHNGILEFLWEKVFFDNVYIPLFLIIQLGILNYIINIIFIIMARKGKWDARELASVNMLIKLIQIPGYLYIFVMGVACLATIFSMGISIALILLDCFCIGMTGLLSVAAFYGMEKEGRLSRTKQIVCTIGSFIFCVDVVLAVVGYKRSRA